MEETLKQDGSAARAESETRAATNGSARRQLRMAVIGAGYWGPNLIRNFSALENCERRAVCDADPARLAPIGRVYPGLKLERDARALLADPQIDAVAICTPVHTHFPLGKAALEADKHVLLEKPLAHSV